MMHQVSKFDTLPFVGAGIWRGGPSDSRAEAEKAHLRLKALNLLMVLIRQLARPTSKVSDGPLAGEASH